MVRTRRRQLTDIERYAAAGLFCMAFSRSQRIRAVRISDDSSSIESVNAMIEPELDLLGHMFRCIRVEPRKSETIIRLVKSGDSDLHIETFFKILSSEEKHLEDENSRSDKRFEKRVRMFMLKEFGQDSSISPSTPSLQAPPSSKTFPSPGDPHTDAANNNLISQTNSQPTPEDLLGTPSSVWGKRPIDFHSDVLQKNLDGNDLLSSYSRARETNKSKSTRKVRPYYLDPGFISSHLKFSLLWELVSACISDEASSKNRSKADGKKGYDSRLRVAMRHLAMWFGLDWRIISSMEMMVAFDAMNKLKEGENKSNEKTGAAGDEEPKDDNSESYFSAYRKGALIGATAVGSGALLALTGGLAAPAIVAGISALGPLVGAVVPFGSSIIGAAAFAAGTSIGSASIIGAFGAAGAGLGGYKMARRMDDVKEFYFVKLPNQDYIQTKVEEEGACNADGYDQMQVDNIKETQSSSKKWSLYEAFTPIKSYKKIKNDIKKCRDHPRMAVAIVISGMVKSIDDFFLPWSKPFPDMETFSLVYESEILIPISTSIEDWMRSAITTEIIKRGAMFTVLSTLVSAVSLPLAFLSLSNFIDGKWTLGINRSDKAGEILADVLLQNKQGSRSVTLIGFSMGARVIWSCLNSLVSRGHKGGIIERVVILGAPVPASDYQWPLVRRIVSGRFVNGFSTSDWTLGLVYRTSFLASGICGIQAVNCPGIENVDLTSYVPDGHSSYLPNLESILQYINIDSYADETYL